MDMVLEIHNLSKSYDGFSLRDINMSLERGTLIGFIKGDTAALLPDYKNHFIGINKSAYGFEGLTDNKAALKRVMPNE